MNLRVVSLMRCGMCGPSMPVSGSGGEVALPSYRQAGTRKQAGDSRLASLRSHGAHCAAHAGESWGTRVPPSSPGATPCNS